MAALHCNLYIIRKPATSCTYWHPPMMVSSLCRVPHLFVYVYSKIIDYYMIFKSRQSKCWMCRGACLALTLAAKCTSHRCMFVLCWVWIPATCIMHLWHVVACRLPASQLVTCHTPVFIHNYNWHMYVQLGQPFTILYIVHVAVHPLTIFYIIHSPYFTLYMLLSYYSHNIHTVNSYHHSPSLKKLVNHSWCTQKKFWYSLCVSVKTWFSLSEENVSIMPIGLSQTAAKLFTLFTILCLALTLDSTPYQHLAVPDCPMMPPIACHGWYFTTWHVRTTVRDQPVALKWCHHASKFVKCL